MGRNFARVGRLNKVLTVYILLVMVQQFVCLDVRSILLICYSYTPAGWHVMLLDNEIKVSNDVNISKGCNSTVPHTVVIPLFLFLFHSFLLKLRWILTITISRTVLHDSARYTYPPACTQTCTFSYREKFIS